jgi:hypothetical protein
MANSPSFVGFERIESNVFGRTGSAVIRHEGTFDGSQTHSSYTIVPNSGTGELASVLGGGSSSVGHADEHPMTLDIDQP